jgi:pyruvate/2-oxoglutarate dehydrogenase complex dihydrolipoamide acyltransferase (E2) component
MAKSNKIDLNKITGTGKKGRILKEDIINYL